MNNKVVSYHPKEYGEYQLGFCKVDIDGKAGLVLKVVKSKAGHIYCNFNSIKIEERWEPIFSFSDSDYQRNFLNDCRDQVIILMAGQDNQRDQQSTGFENKYEQYKDQGIPF